MSRSAIEDGTTSALSGRDLMIPHRLLHPPREVQILLGVSHAQVYRLIAAGRLKAVKIGSRTGITRESINAVACGTL
jgi:excisionase family DNA binding protein